jgi:peptidoglycan/xylan/chitin deacetylase (PgdA/CDA1 family)
MAKLLGLRVDVDTHEGMRYGVPHLLAILSEVGARGSFYLAMGPDRSGLAVFNAFKPGFLEKMGRTRAASVYGWRTVLSGTLLPARPVATAFPDLVRRIVGEGHETGTHGWDHRSWQDRLDKYPDARVAEELDRARDAFRTLFGRDPITAACPAWLTDDRALRHQDGYGMAFATDCRGAEPFIPSVGGVALKTPQVPATLPTLDEALGDVSELAGTFFEGTLRAATEQAWPVLTVHAELEGGPYGWALRDFLHRAKAAGIEAVPMGEVLAERKKAGPLLPSPVGRTRVAGRHGEVSVQGSGASPQSP